MNAGSDSGNSNTDNLTNDDSPTFRITSGSGDFETDDRIQLYLNGTYTTVSDSTPNDNTADTFDVTPSATLSDDDYSVTVKIADDAGNTSDVSGSLSITIDTDEPSKPGTPDLDLAYDTGNSATDNITNLGTGSDNLDFTVGSVSAGDSVRLKFGSTIVGREKVGSGNSSVNFTINNQTQGDYNVTAIEYDPAGNNSTTSEILSLTIDTDSPDKPTIDLKASSDLGQYNNDDVTSVQTPTLTFGNLTVADSIIIYNSGVRIQAEEVDAATMNIDLSTALADASHTLSAKAVDPAGNVSTASDNLTITIDTADPAASNLPDLNTTFDTGFSDADNYTSSTTPTFT